MRIAHDDAWELALTISAAALLHQGFRKWQSFWRSES
jgi:hypothetical protein